MSTVVTDARFGYEAAYAIEGDQARLEADVQFDSVEQSGATGLALQLWAEPFGLVGGAVPTLVAELTVPEFQVYGGGATRLCGMVPAYPPAGQYAHSMSLALVQRSVEGDRMLDRFQFSRPESFVLPFLEGSVSYHIDDAGIRVNLERIVNPRVAGSLSGTLAVALWALPAPYAGGAFSGYCIGSVDLGVLGGGESWADVTAALPAPSLPPGQWSLVLMLREWMGNGYITRDFTNFALPFELAADVDGVNDTIPSEILAHSPVETPAPAVADESLVAAMPAMEDPALPVAEELVAGALADTPVVSLAEEKPAKVPEVSASKSSKAKPAKPAKNKAAKATASQPVAAIDRRVNLNSASVDEIAALPGLTSRLAAAIVAGRPWKSVNALTAVKGIGERTLDRIRSRVTV